MTTRRELRALERKVRKAIPEQSEEVKIFIKNTAVGIDDRSNNPFDEYHNPDGEQFTLQEIKALKQEGTKCVCVVGVESIPDYDLKKLSDEDLETLENILTKAEGRDETAAAAVRAVL